MKNNFLYSTRSNIGGRERNEDAFQICINNSQLLLVVCDGVGSEEESQMSSFILTNTIVNNFKSKKRIINFKKFIFESIKKTHLSFDNLKKSRSLKTSSCTLCACIINKNGTCKCVNLGDSRIYLYNGVWHQISHDQNLEYFINKKYSLLQQKNPKIKDKLELEKNTYLKENKDKLLALTNFFDPEKYNSKDDFEFFKFKIKKDDFVLLCSDGLSNFINFNNVDINTIQNNFSDSAQYLVNLSIENHTNDNVTTLLGKLCKR